MTKQVKTPKVKRTITLDGLMTVSKLKTGMRTMDFMCCEDVQVEAYIGRYKVQGMRDGNMYMEELPKRVRNKPLLRLDHSSFTLGRDGQYYFSFRLSESEAELLPDLLMAEAKQTIARIKEMNF